MHSKDCWWMLITNRIMCCLLCSGQTDRKCIVSAVLCMFSSCLYEKVWPAKAKTRAAVFQPGRLIWCVLMLHCHCIFQMSTENACFRERQKYSTVQWILALRQVVEKTRRQDKNTYNFLRVSKIICALGRRWCVLYWLDYWMMLTMYDTRTPARQGDPLLPFLIFTFILFLLFLCPCCTEQYCCV